ncbi:MAG: hypothetical protein M1818_006434 [Claussenomyces sp. TS43310]|nr:MAG: hypothetical protein M1818_006434 [Claussenomyces sp. TS43310]
MSAFQMPVSSSPPSTPDRRSSGGANHWFGETNPSTTPAGPPPPSSAGSFTPAGPPPSSVPGSSRLDAPYDKQSSKPLNFSNQTSLNSSNFGFNNAKSSPPSTAGGRSFFGAPRSGLSNEYKASPEPTYASGDEVEDGSEENGQYQYDEEYSDEQDDVMAEAAGDETYYEDEPDVHDPGFNSSGPMTYPSKENYGSSRNSDVLGQSPARFSQSGSGDLLHFDRSLETSRMERPKDDLFGKIAKDICGQMGMTRIEESDELILGTEEIITRLYEGIGANDDEDALHRSLTTVPAELTRLWADYDDSITQHISEEYTTSIGPGPNSPRFSKANFLASLLLRLHHPAPVQLPGDASQALKGALRSFALTQSRLETKPIPMLLLEWIDEYHEPYPSQLDELCSHRPSPAHHQLFWETVLNSLLRGKVHGVTSALKSAGWRHARTATEDLRNTSGEGGYSGKALENIDLVIGEATQALSRCPAITGDWDIRNSNWTLFRLGIQQARENLKSFAEGRNRDKEFSEYSKKIKGDESMTATARKAQSQVPWSIYQRLLTVYNLVLGDSSTIIETAMDWCEASIGLVIWWDPSKDNRRHKFGQSRAPSDVSDQELYVNKLAHSFYRSTSDSTDFQVNTLNPVEVGLACLFEGDVEAVVTLLRSWSGPVSAAVVEVASLGGWLPREDQSLIAMDNLDQDDMAVLGINLPSKQIDDIKDRILITYAEALAQHGTLQSTARFGHPKRTREGWELALEVLGRLNSISRSEEEVSDMLKNFTFDSGANVDKMWRLLNDLGMTKHAENVAEEYADSIAEHSHKYGEALWYYALSHKSQKVKDVLDLLISFSLIHSMAFPPSSEVDPYLERLISSPTAALAEMSKLDFDAAQIIHKYLSGYATLRRFYNLRDEEVHLVEGQKPSLRPMARRAEALSALMAVIASADDNIRGGLYDESRGAIVSVDFLLALLGEAMVFVNQQEQQQQQQQQQSPPRQPPIGPCLSLPQIYTLLKTIEDLQTVAPTRISSACHDFFDTVVASVPGLKGSSPLDLLRKSSSGLSAGGSFSLVGSSMMASQLQRSIAGGGGSSGSAASALSKSNVKRGWDWRKGLTATSKGEDILRILRLGLAKDLARAWIQEVDNPI